MLTFKLLLKLVIVGSVIYQFIYTYQKEKSNGLESRDAIRKAGNSAFGVFRTGATAAILLFSFSDVHVDHGAAGTDLSNVDHDAVETDLSQNPRQTNIGFVNVNHTETVASNHDTLDTYSTTSIPSSNGWDFVAQALPWLIVIPFLGL